MFGTGNKEEVIKKILTAGKIRSKGLDNRKTIYQPDTGFAFAPK